MANNNKFSLVVILVNTGFSEVVMSAAREVGARGGTIVHARGTGNKEIYKKFNIVITPDKEMIMIVVTSKIKDAVLSAIYSVAGLNTPGQGIAFTLPIEDVVGMKFDDDTN